MVFCLTHPYDLYLEIPNDTWYISDIEEYSEEQDTLNEDADEVEHDS